MRSYLIKKGAAPVWKTEIKGRGGPAAQNTRHPSIHTTVLNGELHTSLSQVYVSVTYILVVSGQRLSKRVTTARIQEIIYLLDT
jgi:hypothetical protein